MRIGCDTFQVHIVLRGHFHTPPSSPPPKQLHLVPRTARTMELVDCDSPVTFNIETTLKNRHLLRRISHDLPVQTIGPPPSVFTNICHGKTIATNSSFSLPPTIFLLYFVMACVSCCLYTLDHYACKLYMIWCQWLRAMSLADWACILNVRSYRRVG